MSNAFSRNKVVLTLCSISHDTKIIWDCEEEGEVSEEFSLLTHSCSSVKCKPRCRSGLKMPFMILSIKAKPHSITGYGPIWDYQSSYFAATMNQWFHSRIQKPSSVAEDHLHHMEKVNQGLTVKSFVFTSPGLGRRIK